MKKVESEVFEYGKVYELDVVKMREDFFSDSIEDILSRYSWVYDLSTMKFMHKSRNCYTVKIPNTHHNLEFSILRDWCREII